MTASAYLFFDGRCEEAVNFYAGATGGKIEALMKFSGTPAEAHVPPGSGDKILHARLSIDGTSIMASDGVFGEHKEPRGFSVALQTTSVAEAERVFQALSEGGRVEMPLQQTFWSARYGQLVDKFGVSWMVNCDAKS